MTNILAIDTATDACSVAVYLDGVTSALSEVVPRQHNQRLFVMLRELLPSGNLRAQGIDAIAYGCGPGSFTGLRIAASAVQGLAYANNLPAIAISTLACQAQTALRLNLVQAQDTVLSMIDARVNEVYSALFEFDEGVAVARGTTRVCAPEALSLDETQGQIVGVGSGFGEKIAMPTAVSSRMTGVWPELLPAAQDLIPLALLNYQRNEIQSADQVAPVYVRDEISWKKLAEQGKPGA